MINKRTNEEAKESDSDESWSPKGLWTGARSPACISKADADYFVHDVCEYDEGKGCLRSFGKNSLVPWTLQRKPGLGRTLATVLQTFSLVCWRDWHMCVSDTRTHPKPLDTV